MAKVKYRFNAETLSYIKVEVNLFRKFISRLAPAIVIAALMFFVYAYFIDSPRAKKLRRENELLEQQYDTLNNKLEGLKSVLTDIRSRDNNIYRAIFETEPINQNTNSELDPYLVMQKYMTDELLENTSVKLDTLSKGMNKQTQLFSEIDSYLKKNPKILQQIPSIQPVPNKDLKHLIYGFGQRIDPIYKTPSFHDGMDFAAPMGTQVLATADGTVLNAGFREGGSGQTIEISHNFGYVTHYSHLSKITIRSGQKVTRGQVIGIVGNTGKSTGIHVHYLIRKDGKVINPINFFFGDLTPDQYDKIFQLAASAGQPMD